MLHRTAPPPPVDSDTDLEATQPSQQSAHDLEQQEQQAAVEAHQEPGTSVERGQKRKRRADDCDPKFQEFLEKNLEMMKKLVEEKEEKHPRDGFINYVKEIIKKCSEEKFLRLREIFSRAILEEVIVTQTLPDDQPDASVVTQPPVQTRSQSPNVIHRPQQSMSAPPTGSFYPMPPPCPPCLPPPGFQSSDMSQQSSYLAPSPQSQHASYLASNLQSQQPTYLAPNLQSQQPTYLSASQPSPYTAFINQAQTGRMSPLVTAPQPQQSPRFTELQTRPTLTSQLSENSQHSQNSDHQEPTVVSIVPARQASSSQLSSTPAVVTQSEENKTSETENSIVDILEKSTEQFGDGSIPSLGGMSVLGDLSAADTPGRRESGPLNTPPTHVTTE